MGSSYQFIEAPNVPSNVLEWFRDRDEPPHETPTHGGIALYFRQFGPLVYDASGGLDAARSPVVHIVLPRIRREVLWTVGKVDFLSTLHLPQNRPIQRVARAFARWIKHHERVHRQSPRAENPFDYYLEGSCRNRGDIYALPCGLAALKQGRYFVGDDDNDAVLERLCRALRLRGITCGAVGRAAIWEKLE